MKTPPQLPIISICSLISALLFSSSASASNSDSLRKALQIPTARAAQSLLGAATKGCIKQSDFAPKQAEQSAAKPKQIPTAPEMSLKLNKPASYDKGAVIKLNFKQEIVSNEQVGKAVDPSIWALAPNFAHDAYWANTSAIALVLKEDFSFRQKAHFELKPELRSLKGHRLAENTRRQGIQDSSRSSLNAPYHTSANEAIILGSVNPDEAALLKQQIAKGHYKISSSSEYENSDTIPLYIPLSYRPLRVQDLLDKEKTLNNFNVHFNDWKQLKESLLAQQKKQEREANKAAQPTSLNADELNAKSIIPGFWYIYPYLKLKNEQKASLSLPLMGYYDSRKGCWGDGIFSRHQIAPPEYQIFSKRPEDKQGSPYLIELRFSIPLAATQVKSTLSKLQWLLNKSYLKPNEECSSLSYDASSKSYRAEIDGKTYELLLDLPSSKKRSILQMKQGKEVAIELYDSLSFSLQTHEQPLRLSCQAEIELLNGEKTSLFVPRVIPAPKIPDSTPAFQVARLVNAHKLAQQKAQTLPYRYQTKLIARRPYLSSEASLNNIMQQGSQSIPCRYRNLKNVRARITRIDASPQHAAQAIALYRASEKSSLPLPANASPEEQEKWAEQIKKSPLAGHPAILSVSEIALPDGSHHLSINLPESKIKNLDTVASEPKAPAPPEAAPYQANAKAVSPVSAATPRASTAPTAPATSKPSEPAVLYLLEITGTAADNWRAAQPEHKNALFYNRGLIQSSNLGLVWKKSSKKIYLYPYQLSDGKAPTKLKAYFLDAEGRSLGSHSITSEGQCLPLDKKLSYISLHQGNDRYTLSINQKEAREGHDNYSARYANLDGIDRSNLAVTDCFLFTEREEYRAGEDVYIKGIIRSRFGNQLLPPSGIEKLCLNIKKNRETLSSETVELQADGSFNFCYKLPEDAEGYYSIESIISFKTDADKSSPDMKILQSILDEERANKENAVELSRDERYNLNTRKWSIKNSIKNNREQEIPFIVEEFSRPEFELLSKADINEEQDIISLQSQANQYTGVPLSKGLSKWVIDVEPSFYASALHQGYQFGSLESHIRDIKLELKNDLDAEGKGSLSIPIPKLAEASFMNMKLTNSVTNKQGKVRRQSMLFHSKPADIAVGIKEERYRSFLSRDKSLNIQLRSIDRADKPCILPSPMKLSVRRESYYYSLQGLIEGHQSRDHKLEELVFEKELLPSAPDSNIDIPILKEGNYIISISGLDAKNRPYLSTQTHRVYGKMPSWERQSGKALRLIPDKESYRPGEIARLRLESPVAAELILSIEREDILRHSRHQISPANPIIEIPIEEGDAPLIHISAFLIESRKKEQEYSQPPLLKMDTCILRIKSEKQKLSIDLEKSKESLQPQEELKIRGQVRDSEGKAVPKAHITLYAVDEAILTLTGKVDAPDALSFFNKERPLLVKSYSSQYQTLGDSLKRRVYGNKGSFIGGGGDDTYGSEAPLASAPAMMKQDAALGQVKDYILRSDFRPVAFWLGYQQSDEQGQFEVLYKNPDTLTRYRIIALANDGKDKFGQSESAYEVSKAIMLEANAPKLVVQGDLIHIPLSITLKPDKLKGIAAKDITWSIRATTSKGISLPAEAEKFVLSEAGIHPLSIPIQIAGDALGEAEITWMIEGHLSDGRRIAHHDSLLSKLSIRPNLPILRENILLALPAAKEIALLDSIRARYYEDIKLQMTLSPSPLIALNKHIAKLLKPEVFDYKLNINQCIPYIISDELIRYTGLPAATLVEGSPAAAASAEIDIKQNSPLNLSDMLKRIIKSQQNGLIQQKIHSGQAPVPSNAYALLLLQLAQDKGKLPADSAWALEMGYNKLKEAFKLSSKEGSNMTTIEHRAATVPLGLYSLARANQLSPAEFDLFLAQQKKNKIQAISYNSQVYRQLIALVARLIKHPQADAFLQAALEKGTPCRNINLQGLYKPSEVLPSLRVLQVLEHIARAPQDPKLLPQLLIVLRETEGQPDPTSWELAWHYLLMERYIQALHIAQDDAILKGGQKVSNSQPLLEEIASMSALAEKRYLVEQGSLYAIGSVEGYRSEGLRDIVQMSDGTSIRPPHSNRLVKPELSISRSYDRALPNGQWESTSSPQLGDIVRIRLQVQRLNELSLAQTISITDSLPACMESINPKLLEKSINHAKEGSVVAQIIGAHNARKEISYNTHGAQFILRDGLDKDNKSTCDYYARVTKSGRVHAPAAKANFLYKPSIYGLSKAQHFDIKAKESK